MAQTSTIYNFDVTLSDVDRGVYESLKLQLARHPSETLPFLITRLLAYCLEFREGLAFTKGLSDSEEPALWAQDRTGELTLWVEVGVPRAERLHKASKRGIEVAVYVHKDPKILHAQLKGERIHNGEKIKVCGFSAQFFDEIEPLIEKRTTLSISVSEGQLYVSIGAATVQTPILQSSVASAP